ncbi:hypothetical protein ABIB42_005003 [Massilia sp. UYP32]|jgi:hypothetical protein|uniref:hypothetical protein n=1 Tax=Massilia TaxID=149698 RepID=UPI000D939ACC|nr:MULTISPECIES: hypothetical protein [Massilia]QYG02975.1 hypothetical protein KY496_06100 [Massilia sp. NP310]
MSTSCVFPVLRQSVAGALLMVTIQVAAGPLDLDDPNQAMSMAGLVCLDSHPGAERTPVGSRSIGHPEFNEWMTALKAHVGSCFSARRWVTPPMCKVLLDKTMSEMTDEEITDFQKRFRAELGAMTEMRACWDRQQAASGAQREN